MSARPTDPTLHDRLLSDIADELKSLKGAELEAFLSELGDTSADASEAHDRALQGARAALGRRKLDKAKSYLKQRRSLETAKIFAFNISKKRALVAAVEKRGQANSELTMAARNRRAEAESDIDALLEAFLQLGLINEDGELSD